MKALFGFFLGVAVIAACAGPRGTTPTAQATLSDSADQIMYGVRHFMVDNGVKQGQLMADTAYVLNGNTTFELRGVRLLLFDSAGTTSATLTSREATYSTVNKRMEARGTVVVTTIDGKRLDTPHLIYDQRDNTVRSDSSFVLVEQTQEINGQSFTSLSDMSNLTCVQCVYTGVTPRPDTGFIPPPGSGG